MRQIDKVLQNAQSTGNGAEHDLRGQSQEVSLYIIGSTGVSAGAVQFETADTPGYAGTWAPLGAAVTVAADTQKIVQITGVLNVVRARISTNITGGTVTTRLVASTVL